MESNIQVGIDGYWMIDDYRGMGSFAWQLIEPLADKCSVFIPDNSSKLKIVNNKYQKLSKKMFLLWEQLSIPCAVKKNKVEYMIYPYNTGAFRKVEGKRISIIHDLIFLKSKKELPYSASMYQNLGRLYRKFFLGINIKNADYIVTVSQFTKSELIKEYGLNESKITVIPNSLPEHWYQTLPKDTVSDKYLFTVAGEAPSKNLTTLLDAFALALSKYNIHGLKLTIAGVKSEYHHKYLQHCKLLGIDSYVEFLGYISTNELKSLYVNSYGFIFASLFEGFGIPLIEALASRTPVAFSNVTSLPEIAADCGISFNPYDMPSIAEAISQLFYLDEKLKVRMVDKGFKRALDFQELKVRKDIENFWSFMLEPGKD
ncbi:glycosyltransferase family 4 protein [Enterobacillus tribolii]|nr:glycosyltransferase family 1 protein [Enterobacillus tribolii]